MPENPRSGSFWPRAEYADLYKKRGTTEAWVLYRDLQGLRDQAKASLPKNPFERQKIVARVTEAGQSSVGQIEELMQMIEEDSRESIERYTQDIQKLEKIMRAPNPS